MERVFADTGYWIALLNPRDEPHEKASEAARDSGLNGIVTSEMVLTEFLNSLSDYGSGLRQAAARAVVALQGSSHIVILPQTSQLFEKALQAVSGHGRQELEPHGLRSFCHHGRRTADDGAYA